MSLGDLHGLRRPPRWTEEALCAQIGDDELWFPAKGQPLGAAKRVCYSCPVMEQCREYALNSPTPLAGVWGGQGARERQVIRAQRNRGAA